jgi:MarR family transcriptional regulator, lower aerobic nicotinate degradation pathway regulator
MELPDTLTARVGFVMQLALLRVQRAGEAALAELSLRDHEYGLLALLENGPVARQHELGAVLGMDRTTTAKVVRSLVGRGLVVRHPAPGDSRALVLTLTPEGDRLRAAAAAALERCDDEFLAPLPTGERERLHATLRRLAR